MTDEKVAVPTRRFRVRLDGTVFLTAAGRQIFAYADCQFTDAPAGLFDRHTVRPEQVAVLLAEGFIEELI